MILTDKKSLKLDLIAYGEFDLALKVDSISDVDMHRIGKLAMKHINNGTYISKHLTMGAIAFFEGQSREPQRKRRDLSVYKKSTPEHK